MINIHELDGVHKVPQCLRRLLSSRFLYVLFMTPCTLNKTRPLEKVSSNEVFGNLRATPQKNTQDGKSSNQKKAPKDFFQQSQKAPVNKTLTDVITIAKKVESDENMIFFWKVFAVFLDRVMFLLNILVVFLMLIIFRCLFKN